MLIQSANYGLILAQRLATGTYLCDCVQMDKSFEISFDKTKHNEWDLSEVILAELEVMDEHK